MQRYLIVNADDLGLSAGVNRAVLEASRQGIVTSASLMANMPFARDAVERVISQHPRLGVGLHFCLTSGRPVVSPQRLPLLTNRRGVFRWGFAGLAALVASPRRRQVLGQIRRELVAQLERLARWGIPLDHMDSHRHVHMIPGIFALVAEEASARGLAVRRAVESVGASRLTAQRVARWLQGGGLARHLVLSRMAAQTDRLAGRLCGTRGAFGILDSGRMDRTAWAGILDWIEGGTYEVIVHPAFQERSAAGWACSRNDRRFALSPRRQEEFETLVDPGLADSLRAHAIRLTRYDDMPRAAAMPGHLAPRRPFPKRQFTSSAIESFKQNGRSAKHRRGPSPAAIPPSTAS